MSLRSVRPLRFATLLGILCSLASASFSAPPPLSNDGLQIDETPITSSAFSDLGAVLAKEVAYSQKGTHKAKTPRTKTPPAQKTLNTVPAAQLPSAGTNVSGTAVPSPVQTADASQSQYSGPDHVIDDFEGGLKGWQLTGDAFSVGTTAQFTHTTGVQGMSFLVSFPKGAGAAATGTATSAPFVIDRPFLNFRVAGGASPATFVGVTLDGGKTFVQTACGMDSTDMREVCFDLYNYRGKTAQICVVDSDQNTKNSSPYGFMAVDNFRLSERPGSWVGHYPDPTIQHLLDNFTQRLQKDYGLPGVWAVVCENGQILGQTVVGNARLGPNPVPSSISQQVAFGSTSKHLTDLLTDIYIQKGLLSWDTRIGQVVPDLVKHSDLTIRNITVGQALLHNSFPAS